MKHLVLIPLVLLFASGCVDDRVKRASSVLNAKTQVANEEFDKATTPEAKIKVANDYFKTAPAMTQVLQDYLTGVDPKKPVIKEDPKVPESMVDVNVTPRKP
jgi:hypothetical protein